MPRLEMATSGDATSGDVTSGDDHVWRWPRLEMATSGDATSGDGHDYCALKHLCRLLDFEETVDAL